MRCKTCDYPLWQLTARQCPECGTPFKPSDYEFTLNSVRFCCPHCNQAYYGTGDKGQLVPRTLACVNCARTIDMDEMVLLPTEGVTERQTEVTNISWANRRNRGRFASFFITMGTAMGNPHRAIDSVPESSSAGLAIAYMALHVIPQILFGGGVFFIWTFAMVASVGSRGGGPAAGIIAVAIASVLCAPLLAIVWTAVVHGLLRLTGPTAHGFKRTLHATCYSAGNNFICAIPCLGFYFCWAGALWWTISSAFMIARAQQVRAWRVWIACGIPLIVAVGLPIGGIVAAIFGVQSRVSSVMASMPGMPSAHANNAAAGQRVSSVLISATPAHPAELLLDHRLQPEELLLPGDASDTRSCSVQNTPLTQLGYTFSTGQQRPLRARIQGDPSLSGPACRVGDFVFTYAGMATPPPDKGLWLAIGWPDPSLNQGDPTEVVLVQPQGRSTVIGVADFDDRLAAQNELRAKFGLPATPHPRNVLATSVKVASPVMVGGGPFPGMMSSGANVNEVLVALLAANPPVRHAAELLGSEAIAPTDLVDMNHAGGGGVPNATMRTTVVGGTTLANWETASTQEQRRSVQLAVASLPPNAVAYKLGDLIFTHPGIDINAANASPDPDAHLLWLVVEIHQPSGPGMSGRSRRSGGSAQIGLTNGTVITMPSDLTSALADQNVLRARFGLPPLPDLSSITDTAPATAPEPPKMTLPATGSNAPGRP